jgi:uncharacterized RDD family membrane protein YckC
MQNLLTIDTPENIDFQFDIAGLGSRLFAAVIDFIVLGFIFIVCNTIMLMIVGSSSEFFSNTSGVTAFVSIFWFVFQWFYFVIFELIWDGQSIGKRLLQLRVIKQNGQPLTFTASIIRNLIRTIDFLPMLYGLGLIVAFIHPRTRRLGDLAAGTIVVKEHSSITLSQLVESNAKPDVALAIQGIGQTLDNVHLLTEEDYLLVRDFLEQAPMLNSEARNRLGIQLAQTLQARLSLPEGGNAEQFLRYVANEYLLYKQSLSESSNPTL